MNNIRKELLIKASILSIILILSFILIKVVIKDDNNYVETLVLIGTCITILSILLNYKLTPYVSSLAYIVSYFIIRSTINNERYWIISYIAVVILAIFIDKLMDGRRND